MRGKGEGSVFKDARTGLWTAIIELPARDGDRRRKTIRRKRKQDVLDEMSNVKAELKKRGDLPTKGQTVEQWFAYWQSEIAAKRVRPKTLSGYTASVGHITKAIGKVKLESVTAAHVRRVHNHITETLGLSSTTALLAHRVMAVSFKDALREGRVSRNPAELTDAPRKAAASLEVLTLEEALKVLQATEGDPLRARWVTAFLTAARRAEVIGLERDRVTDVLDLSWQLLRLPLTETDGKPDVPEDYEYRHLTGGLYLTRPKSNHGWRIIPLISVLHDVLAEHIASTPDNEWGLVFVGKNGRPLDPDQDSKDWRALLKKSGVKKNVRLHDVRHTTVDLLYAFGVPEDIIVQLVGHSKVSMTRAYKSRTDLTRTRGALELFNEQFKSIGSGTPPAIEP